MSLYTYCRMPERAIVQYGIYVFAPEDRECFRVRLTTQVERVPYNLSSNFKLQYPRSFYGYAQLMWGKWVVETKPIEYAQQLLFEFTNDLAQLAILEYCAVKQTRDNILALSGCIPGCVLRPGEEQIPGLWRFPYDRVVFKLFNDTTLLVNTDRQNFYNPCEVPLVFADETYTPPEPSETDVPENPLDPGYDVPTAPYDPPSSDFGETYNPQRPAPEQGEEGVNYQVCAYTRYINGPGGAETPYNQCAYFAGPITAPEVEKGQNGALLYARIGFSFGNPKVRTYIAQVEVSAGPNGQYLIDSYEFLDFTVTRA